MPTMKTFRRSADAVCFDIGTERVYLCVKTDEGMTPLDWGSIRDLPVVEPTPQGIRALDFNSTAVLVDGPANHEGLPANVTLRAYFTRDAMIPAEVEAINRAKDKQRSGKEQRDEKALRERQNAIAQATDYATRLATAQHKPDILSERISHAITKRVEATVESVLGALDSPIKALPAASTDGQ